MKCGIICKIFKSTAKGIAIEILNDYANKDNINELTNAIASDINKKYGIDKSVAKNIAKSVITGAITELEEYIEHW